jgi:hypothetical protein
MKNTPNTATEVLGLDLKKIEDRRRMLAKLERETPSIKEKGEKRALEKARRSESYKLSEIASILLKAAKVKK